MFSQPVHDRGVELDGFLSRQARIGINLWKAIEPTKQWQIEKEN